MSDTFPLSSVSRSEQRTTRYLAAIQEALLAVQAGKITNVRYNDLKSSINMQLYDAWTQTMLKLLPDYKAPDYKLASDIYSMSPQLHTAMSKAAKIEKMKLDLPIKATALAFLAEIKPLCEAFEALKGMAQKREIKPIEDRRAKYNAPAASKSAIGMVKTRLEEITQDARDALVEYYTTSFTRALARLIAKQAEVKAISPNKSVRLNEVLTDALDAYVVALCCDITHHSPQRLAHTFTQKPGAAAIIAAQAAKTADEVRENFVYKNLAKFDSIVTAKPDLASVEITSRTVSLGGLEGTLRVTFEDGAAFTANNAVVWSRSVHGTQFQRFPLTFHAVVMADGTKMGKPSEERMNTVFVGKAAA